MKYWRSDLVRAAVGTAVAVCLLASCGQGSSDAEPSSPQQPTGTTKPRQSDAENAEALKAYRAMWRDLARASETSDADSPLLDDHATEDALKVMKYGLEKSKKEGVVSKGSPRVHPKVVSTTRDKVVLEDCVDDSRWLLYKRNGELKNKVPGGHLKTDATVRRVREMWKVTDLFMHETGSC